MTKDIYHGNITGSMSGGIGLDGNSSKWAVSGDISAAKEEVKRSKELGPNKKTHFRHMAEIPYIVVLELLTKHGIDILDGEFMKNPANGKRLRQILQTEYPDLLVQT